MVRAKMVKPLVSYWFYKDQAKKMLDKYNVDISDQKLVHALHANQVKVTIKFVKKKLCLTIFKRKNKKGCLFLHFKRKFT